MDDASALDEIKQLLLNHDSDNDAWSDTLESISGIIGQVRP